MINFLKSLFCKHHYKFVRNIYGDEIIAWGWKRSAWKCSKCGKWHGKDELEVNHD